MRLVAESLELEGIATVVVGTMRGLLKGLPRVIVTRYGRGQNFGPAGDTAAHAGIVAEALALLDATEAAFRDHKAPPA
ncbi:MAG: hypothetical protein M3N49_05925 [Candidatus Eremiobacteraeota bacterium]|nr:hypothetical protein [Candidatus Eremiobacteraeota bacterium]